MATRWECLGPGLIASDFFLSVSENLPREEHEFVAVASKDLTRAQKFADQFKFKKAYDSYADVAKDADVEIVYIATLSNTHVDLSIKMLDAGKHVLCEKPMAHTLSGARRVHEAARKNNRLFMEAVWTKFFPAYEKIREELSAGSLGIPRLLQASFCVPVMGMERLTNPDLGGGALMDMGLYTIVLACVVFKEVPEEIKAVTLMKGGVDIGGSIIFKYKSGAMANLSFHMDAGMGNRTACIMGDKGMIQIEAPFWCPEKMSTPSGTFEAPLKEGAYNFWNTAGLYYEAAAVRDTLKSGKLENEVCTFADSEMVYTITDEIRRQIGIKKPDFE